MRIMTERVNKDSKVNKKRNLIDVKLGKFYLKHPTLAIILTFVGIPILTTAIIGGITILAIYPIAAAIV